MVPYRFALLAHEARVRTTFPGREYVGDVPAPELVVAPAGDAKPAAVSTNAARKLRHTAKNLRPCQCRVTATSFLLVLPTGPRLALVELGRAVARGPEKVELGRRAPVPLVAAVSSLFLTNMLAQRTDLALVVGADIFTVKFHRFGGHSLERQLADLLAVLDHERYVVRPDLEGRP